MIKPSLSLTLTCRCGAAATYFEIGLSSRIYAVCSKCRHTYDTQSHELTSEIGGFLISSMITAKLTNSSNYYFNGYYECFYVDTDELKSFTSRLNEKIF